MSCLQNVARPAASVLTPTIFHEDWWLDIVTQGTFEAVEVAENGRTVGRFPYFPRRKFGLSAHLMPPLTHFLGPAVDEGEGHRDTRLIKRLTITRELIEKLPRTHLTRIKCHRGITDTIAFQGEDFLTSVQFTFEIPPQPEDVVWKNMRAPRRTVIRGAQREGITTEVNNDPDAFVDFYWTNLELKNKGASAFYPREIVRKLLVASLERNQGSILFARNRGGEPVAAVFYVWDSAVAYYLMTTRRHDSHNGANSLLIWEAIRDSMKRGLTFDLDGLFNKGAIMFLAGFGAFISPRYILTKALLPMRIAYELKTRRLEGYYFS